MIPRAARGLAAGVLGAAGSAWLALAASSPHPPGSVPPALPASGTQAPLWSLRPPQEPALPPPARDGSSHLVDRFLDARMRERGLEPAAVAPREVVLRRLSFVLTGLPPSAEETQAFLADASPDALERVVDRMLASPHFGERWARHWMDVVRYCESHGSQGDPELPLAWRYRDYLVHAFNTDLPYDQFVREQVAGDLLPVPRVHPADGINESAIGPAHLRMVELGYIPVDALDDHVKVVDNQVDVLSKAFLGLTVSCARCHDHKFDPVSQRDFHALFGILSSGRPGQVVVDPPGRDEAALAELAALKARLREDLAKAWGEAAAGMAAKLLAGAALEREIREVEIQLQERRGESAAIEAAAREEWVREARSRAAAAGTGASSPPVPRPLARWTFESGTSDDLGSMHGTVEAGAMVAGGRLRIPGGEAHVVTTPLPVDLQAMTLEAWVALDNLRQQGGGVVTVQTPDSSVFDSIVFGEREPGHWIAGSDFFRRTRDVGGMAETNAPGHLVHVAITHAEDGTITVYRDGVAYGSPYRPGPAHAYRRGIDRVVLGRRHLAQGVGAIAGEVEEARLYDRALEAAEVGASFRAGPFRVPAAELVRFMGPGPAERQGRLQEEVRRLEARLGELKARRPAEDPWPGALAQAARDTAHPLHPWAALHPVAREGFTAAWERLVAARRQEQAEREAFNCEHFRRGWDLRGEDARTWFRGGTAEPPAASAPGDFVIEPGGDRVVTGLLPAGVLSSTLTRKQAGVLLSPRFQITTDQISLRVLGTHANARVVIEGYPIGNGGIYPARGLDRETPGWIRLDTAYRKGSHAYLEVVTAEDFATAGFRSGPRPYQDGRAGFGLAEVVFHDRAEAPRETLWPWRGLAEGASPTDAGALAGALGAHLGRCVERWRRVTATDEDVAFLDAFIRAGLLPVSLGELPALAAEVASFRRVEAALPVPRRAPGMHEVAGYNPPLFKRGDPGQPGPEVPRGFVTVLGGRAYATRGTGRRELAGDLSSPSNPLVARVMVNRLWHHVFGRGIVATPDNLGRLGAAPTHPELLDALAVRFIEEGWSVRRMVRRLVTSAAFARSSTPTEAALARDPANDLLSHARVRRLDAEAVRDALLAVSGQLDRRMGGPGVNVYYTGKTEGGGPSGPLDGECRRSVYQRIRRNAHNPLLEAFDAPKPTSPRGARDVTNVPAQALAMLNDPFVREMALRWAARLVAAGQPREARVRGMLESALGRPAREAEVAAALEHLAELAADHGVAPERVEAHVPTWADLGQSIFGLKEFIYVH